MPASNPANTKAQQPVFVGCLAASIDGVIHPARTPGYAQLGSETDIAHLLTLRDGADAVLVGGETFREYPSHHQGHNKNHFPVVGVMTRGVDIHASISPTAPLFTQRGNNSAPTLIFTKTMPTQKEKAAYPATVEWILLGTNDAQNASLITQTYRQQQAKRVLCEGGGELIGWLIGQKILNELYLTQCPLLLGGVAKGDTNTARPLIGGQGFNKAESPRMALLSNNCYETKQGTECIQHWQIGYKNSG